MQTLKFNQLRPYGRRVDGCLLDTIPSVKGHPIPCTVITIHFCFQPNTPSFSLHWVHPRHTHTHTRLKLCTTFIPKVLLLGNFIKFLYRKLDVVLYIFPFKYVQVSECILGWNGSIAQWFFRTQNSNGVILTERNLVQR